MDRVDEHALNNKRRIVAKYLDQKAEIKEKLYQKKLKDVYDFGLSVSFIRDVLKSKNWFWRLLWGGLAIAAVTMCVSELTTLFNNFYAAPTNTRITNKVNDSIHYPFVTVCTYARVNQSKIREINVSNDLLTYMLSSFKGMYLFYNNFNLRMRQERLEDEYQAFLSTQASNFTLTEFFLDYGFNCREFLHACMFQGTDFDCCRDTKEILTDIGKCFVVDNPIFPSQTIPGPSGGLKMYINNFKHLYPNTLINSNPDMGIQVHIIHPEDTAYVGVSPVIIFPGTHALIRMNAVYQKQLKTPRADSCTDDMTLKYFEKYSFEACFTECIVEMTLKTCRCVQIGTLPDYKKLSEYGKTMCTPVQATSCVQPLLQANNMGFLWDIYDIETNCECPLPCKQWSYETSVSYSQVPNPGFQSTVVRQQMSKGNDSDDEETSDEEDYIVVDLFFDNLVYDEISESSVMNPTAFMSQIGGQLSIWLGIRLITFVHLAFYSITMIRYIIPVWIRKGWRYTAGKLQAAEKEDTDGIKMRPNIVIHDVPYPSNRVHPNYKQDSASALY